MSPMYAVIEEVVGPISYEHGVRDKILNSSSNGNGSEKVEEGNRPSQVMNLSSASLLTAADPKKELQEKQEKSTTEEEEEESIPSSHYVPCGGSPDVTRKRLKNSKRLHRRLYGVRSAPLDRRQKLSQKVSFSMASASTTCESYANPLLETINVLTYDPCEDSDDYYDLDNVYGDRRRSEDKKEVVDVDKNKGKILADSSDLRHHAGEGDRESIEYAGSNSIDSGYKSFCPTPEMPDPSVYGPQASSSNTYSLYSDSSVRSSARSRDKPKIMMGTKLISRQNSATLPRDSSSRRSDSSLYEVNLDHLMYLRQSLLSVIQKCESSSSKCMEESYCNSVDEPSNSVSKALSSENNTVPEAVVETKGGTPCSTYQKTVRFESDVKVSTLGKKQRPDDVSIRSTNQSATPGKRKDNNNECGKRSQSKSILKDPLCENLRSKLESGSPPDCTLEEEIDSLLYGRAEFYDLESVQDFPCSYVTMIEEKYKNRKPSLAKVRKLKGDKSQDFSKTDAESELNAKESSEERNSPSESQKSSRKDFASSSSSSTVTFSTKCRFTEVAKCMIEIIEDLQLKKLQSDSKPITNSPKEKTSSSSSSCQRTSVTLDDQKDDSDNASQTVYGSSVASSSDHRNDVSSVASCYASSVDYHVYEEIAYDFIEDKAAVRPLNTNRSYDIPPPLPARPMSMWQKVDNQGTSKTANAWLASHPSNKVRQSRKPREEGSVRNRPKQRSNLYSLFADKAERRNISRSLEREWRVTGKDDPDDEYGFRKVFPSV